MIELTVEVLRLMETVHWPVVPVVHVAVEPLLHAPLTTAPPRAGLIVTVTIAFQKFLLTVELVPVNDATVTIPLVAG